MMGEKMDEQPSSSASVPQKNWELANQIVDLDSIYDYNEKEQLEIRNAKPWEKDQHLFKEVKISAVALLKMVMHAKRGGNLEVMGLMQGRVEGNAFLVMDSFALPVEGTETRVNAQSAAYEYMTVFTDLCETVGKKEKVVGWYHSHPGYGCWLSGIDVATQSLNQQFQEPWVAIVIDPLRTMSAGKVDIGAFRTYPKGYNPPDDGPSEYQTIPLEKIEDFGVHCKQYYSLDVSFFKSELDSHVLNALWNTYWLNTLTSSPLLSNAAYINNQITDVGSKMKNLEKKWSRGDRSADLGDQLEKAVRDARNIGTELVSSLMIQQLKRSLFNHRCCAHEAENGPAEMPVDEHVPPVQPDAADPNVVAGAMAVHQLVDAVAVQEEPQDMVVEPAKNEMEAAETAQK